MPWVASARLSSAPVALPWLPGCTNTSGPDDGAETLLCCLQPASIVASGGADRPVGGAGVLHCLGIRAAVAGSVGVTPGAPDQAEL
jgi:hypothetical protein